MRTGGSNRDEMWILRRPEENNLVQCMPLNEPFSIGRTGKIVIHTQGTNLI